MAGGVELKKSFLRDEILDHETYTRLAKEERNKKIRELLEQLAKKEKKHMRIWTMLLGTAADEVGTPVLIGLRVSLLSLLRHIFGIALATRILERDEDAGLKRYVDGLRGNELSSKDKAYLRGIISDEKRHETAFASEVEKYEVELGYTQSIILGLNDGLVEILAVVAGLATVATTSFIVVIVGLIAGISGTLSMAGGVYLSSKSQGLVKGDGGKRAGEKRVAPSKEGYYTGIYYFLGALLAVLPFIAGASGLAGIAASIILVSAALIVASTIIAIISGTSVKRRIFEMLAISLGAAFATILFGTFAKTYFGVSI